MGAMRLLASASLLVVLASCGGSDDGAPGMGPTAASDGPPPDGVIEIPLPDELRPYLVGVRDQLVAPLCERSRYCCDFFGFSPRRDCEQLADEVIISGFMGLVLEDISTYRFEPMPAFAEKCVRDATAAQHQCVQSFLADWGYACLRLVRYWDDADPFATGRNECGYDDDEACLVLAGPGTTCAGGRCMPAVQAGLGESCYRGDDAESAAVCAPGTYCDGSPTFPEAVCAAQAGLGEDCDSEPASCQEGLVCTHEDGCQPPSLEGESCEGGRTCAEGLTCPFVSGGSVCRPRAALFGEACNIDTDCIGGTCTNGICRPGFIGYCSAD